MKRNNFEEMKYYDNQNNLAWGNKSELYFVSQVWQLSIFNYIFKHRITIIAGEMKRNNFEEMKESIRNDG